MFLSMLSHFLRRKCNKGFVQVTGSCVNGGADYGMEVLALIDYMDLRNTSVRRTCAIFGRCYLARFHLMIHCMHAL